MNMSRRRLALAPVVALLLSGLVGGPAASAAQSPTPEPTATAAATKTKKKKSKRPTVSSLDKRLKKTEKNLAAARKQLRIVQRATATLVSGLDTVVGANGSIESLLGGGLGDVAGPQLAQLQAILDKSVADQTATNANALVLALQNPALKPQLEQLMTSLFGVSPTTIGQSIANLGPAIQQGLAQITVREQPVLFAKVGGVSSSAVVGGDLPDDLNPLTVSGSVVLNVSGASNTPVQLLAGARSDEGDQPAAKAVLDSIEVEAGSGVTVGGGSDFGTGHRVVGGSGAVVGLNRIERSSALDPTSSKLVDIAQGPLTVSGSGSVLVRFTVRVTDDSAND